MKPQFKKIVCALIALCLVAGSFVPVHAAVTETQPITEGTTAQTSVSYTQGSIFTITIPKTITIDSTKTASYEVSVVGDIASNEAIMVSPDAEVTLVDENEIKDDVTATITQTKTAWQYTEIATGNTNVGNGSIDAASLTAGNWAGTFNFDIELVNLIDFTVNGVAYQASTDMTWQEWIASDFCTDKDNFKIGRELVMWRANGAEFDEGGMVGTSSIDPGTAVKPTDKINNEINYMTILNN